MDNPTRIKCPQCTMSFDIVPEIENAETCSDCGIRHQMTARNGFQPVIARVSLRDMHRQGQCKDCGVSLHGFVEGVTKDQCAACLDEQTNELFGDVA